MRPSCTQHNRWWRFHISVTPPSGFGGEFGSTGHSVLGGLGRCARGDELVLFHSSVVGCRRNVYDGRLRKPSIAAVIVNLVALVPMQKVLVACPGHMSQEGIHECGSDPLPGNSKSDARQRSDPGQNSSVQFKSDPTSQVDGIISHCHALQRYASWYSSSRTR